MSFKDLSDDMLRKRIDSCLDQISALHGVIDRATNTVKVAQREIRTANIGLNSLEGIRVALRREATQRRLRHNPRSSRP